MSAWNNTKFCCLKCRRPPTVKARNKMPEYLRGVTFVSVCENCGKFFKLRSFYEVGKRRFCSVSCATSYSQSNKNYWDSDEDRKLKLRKKQLDKIKSNTWKNPIFIGDARERMIATKNENPVEFTEERKELASKVAAYNIINGKNPKLGCFKYGKIGYYFSKKKGKKIRYRSSYEKKAYEILDSLEDLNTFEIEPFRVPYVLDGKNRSYVPDLLLRFKDDTTKLVEIKPLDKLKTEEVIAKKLYAEKYCKENGIKGGYEIWTETLLFPNRTFNYKES
jgi:hypothetical protein